MMGGGMGAEWVAEWMGGMGGGMMNVPAEKLDDGVSITLAAGKVANYKIATVCLEHGKRDPRPAVPYQIRPLETVMTKPGVAELLTLLGIWQNRPTRCSSRGLAFGQRLELGTTRAKTGPNRLGRWRFLFHSRSDCHRRQRRANRGDRGGKPSDAELWRNEDYRRCRQARRQFDAKPLVTLRLRSSRWWASDQAAGTGVHVLER